MQLDGEQKRQIEEIIRVMECARNYVCYKSGFENLSRIKIIRDVELVECLEENPQTCKLGFSFGYGTFCKCPLRYYIAKNFHK